VVEDSPAEAANLKVGDVILSVNGREVDTPGTLTAIIGTTQPDTEVEIEIVSDGTHETRKVKIAEAPKALAKAPTGLPGVDGDMEVLPGVWVSDLPDELRDSMDLPQNARAIVITRTDEAKMQSRMPLQAGDLIAAVNQSKVASVQQVQKIVNASKRDTVLLLVQRGRHSVFTTVKK